MRFTQGKYDYVIEFEFSSSVDNTRRFQESLKTNKNAVLIPDITTCRILRGNIGGKTEFMNIFLLGNATRVDKDQFIKQNGRKVALTRALNKSASNGKKMTKNFRKIVWDTYNAHICNTQIKTFLTQAKHLIKSNPLVKSKVAEMLAV